MHETTLPKSLTFEQESGEIIQPVHRGECQLLVSDAARWRLVMPIASTAVECKP